MHKCGKVRATLTLTLTLTLTSIPILSVSMDSTLALFLTLTWPSSGGRHGPSECVTLARVGPARFFAAG